MSQLRNAITLQVQETLKIAMQGSTLSASDYFEEDIEKALTQLYSYALRAAMYELLLEEDIEKLRTL
jgi:hypothetical protein